MATLWAFLWWVTLLVPGYAIVRRWFPRELRAGGPAALAVCFVFGLAALVPVAVVAYLLRWSAAGCAAGYVAVVLIGAFLVPWSTSGGLVTNAGRAGRGGRSPRPNLELVALLLIWSVCLVSGSYLCSDGIFHVAKVRFLAEHNLSLANPFTFPDTFDNRHHLSVWHFVLVSHTQLTGTDSLTAWLSAMPICRLAILGAIWRLAYAVFRRQRICAWAAIWTGVGLIASDYDCDQYPSILARLIFLPLAAAYLLEGIRSAAGGRNRWIVLMAIVGLTLGAVHPAGPLLAVAVLSPSAVVLAGLWFRRRRRALPLLGCAAALLCGLPFTVISHVAQAGHEPGASAYVSEKLLSTLPGGWRVVNPASGGLVPALVALVLAWAVLRRRRRFRGPVTAVLLIGVVGLAHALFPPLSTAWLGQIPGFLLVRMTQIAVTLAAVLAVGTAAVLLNVQGRRLGWRLALAVCLAYAGCAAHGVYEPATLARTVRDDYWRWHAEVANLREAGAICRAHVPPGETVLARPKFGYRLSALSDCRVIAVPAGHELLTLDDWKQRHRDVDALLNPNTAERAQRTLLRRYGIRYALLRNEDQAMHRFRDLAAWSALAPGRRYTLWKWSGGPRQSSRLIPDGSVSIR